MSDTGIVYVTKTWNPYPGCSKCSPGCQNCYAEVMAKRLHKIGVPAYLEVVSDHGWTGLVGTGDVDAPARWKKPQRILVQSMGDLFYEGVSDEQIFAVFEVMEQAQQHTYLVLTKRPRRMRDAVYTALRIGMPTEHIWWGVTVENQGVFSDRLAALRCVSGHKWLSIEPLLGPVYRMPAAKEAGIGWVVIGCESGPRRRPCKLRWVTALVDECKGAGIPVFVKQLDIDGRVSHDPAEWPEELRVREYPEGMVI